MTAIIPARLVRVVILSLGLVLLMGCDEVRGLPSLDIPLPALGLVEQTVVATSRDGIAAEDTPEARVERSRVASAPTGRFEDRGTDEYTTRGSRSDNFRCQPTLSDVDFGSEGWILGDR